MDGALIHQLTQGINERTMYAATIWRMNADDLAAIRNEYGRDKAGFTEARESLGITRSESSRMLTVSDTLPADVGYASLPASMQYELAKAVRKSVRDTDELLHLAQALSVSSFRDEVYGRPTEQGIETARRLRCPAGVDDCPKLSECGT